LQDSERFKLLHGPYQRPFCRLGDVLFCDVRSEVIACGISAGPIPMPIGKRRQARSFVVCGGLTKAVGVEPNQAGCHWWGITPPQIVNKWRKTLGVLRSTKARRGSM
jgi:hypothetical protein